MTDFVQIESNLDKQIQTSFIHVGMDKSAAPVKEEVGQGRQLHQQNAAELL